MSLSDAQTAAEPLVTFFTSMIASGFAVSVATQLLKSDLIPIPAQKYPRLTTALISAIGAVAALFLSGTDITLNSILDYVGFTIGVIIMAAVTYHALLKQTTTPK
jgi:peptidoglycan/LPS O-acetylase OafA/YrhL